MRYLLLISLLFSSTFFACSDSPDPSGSTTDDDASMNDDDTPGDGDGAERVTLTVTLTGEGSGVVDGATGIACASADTTTGCTATFEIGSTVTLMVTPSEGSRFVGWSGGCTGTGVCALSLTTDVTVTAELVPATDTFVVSLAGEGNGSVSSEPTGIDCGNGATTQIACSTTFAESTNVTLTASASADSVFAGWSGGCSGSETTCTVSVAQAVAVIATFQPKLVTLSVTVSGSGAGSVISTAAGISCTASGGTCSATARVGSSIVLVATPDAGSQLAGWSGACSGTDGCVVTLTDDVAVSAQFAPLTDTLIVALSGDGVGSVTSSPSGIQCDSGGAACSTSFDYGTEVTLTASAEAGSEFAGWSGACSGTSATCTVSVTAATNVTAAFASTTATLTVVVSGAGSGVVTSAPSGISCSKSGGVCSASFDKSASVTLSVALSGYSAVESWSVSGCSGTACAVSVPQTVSVAIRAQGTWAPTITTIEQGGLAQGQVQALGIDYYIATSGVYPSDGATPGSSPFVGEVMAFAPDFVPAGWLPCDGSNVLIQQYTPLFAVLGITFGGNGTSNFALPDLRATTPLGVGSLTNGQAVTTGGPGGVPTITDIFAGDVRQGLVRTLGVRHLIATQGIFPSAQDGSSDGTPYIGQIILFAGATTPAGMSECDGSLLPISGHEALFAILGTNYGGNGQSTFGLPDLRARAAMNVGDNNASFSTASDFQASLVTTGLLGVPATGQVGVLGVRTMLINQGEYPVRASGQPEATQSRAIIGAVWPFAGSFVTAGSYAMTGALRSISSESSLYSLLGLTYGGDGISTFALPDTQARLILGPTQ